MHGVTANSPLLFAGESTLRMQGGRGVATFPERPVPAPLPPPVRGAPSPAEGGGIAHSEAYSTHG